MTLVDLECGTCGLRWSGRPGAPCPVGHPERPPDRESEIIAEIVRLKHGPNGTGQRGSCEPECLKCSLEKELEEVKNGRAIAYDPAEVERLIMEARIKLAEPHGGHGMYGANLRLVADQLEAARERIADLERQLTVRVGEVSARHTLLIKARTELESELARIAALETALRSLIARMRRTGGYASPEEQVALWEAERVLGGGA